MLKLTQFINPQLDTKQLALLRSLKNSIKRNIILPSISIPKSPQIQYQQKADLIHIFQHLYHKQSMSTSDRNLIRRILLGIFPQKIIVGAGRQFVKFTKLIHPERKKMYQGDGMFYLVVKGEVRVDSEYYRKKIVRGMYFGHLELLSSMGNDSFQFVTQSQTATLLTISSSGFHQFLSPYFKSLYNPKRELLPKLLTQKLEPIIILLLCDQMKNREYRIGEKLNREGQPIKQIVFVEKGQISEFINNDLQNRIKIHNAVGLNQILVGHECYSSITFALQQTKVYTIQLQKFLRIIGQQALNRIRQQNSINSLTMPIIEDQQPHQKTTQKHTKKKAKTQILCRKKPKIQTEHPSDIKKFIKYKKVNLQYSIPKSFRSQSTINQNLKKIYQAQFVFIKGISTSRNIKPSIINKTQPYKLQQINTSKFYLENVQLPALAQYQLKDNLIRNIN